MMRRSQSATEYLLMLAAALVMVLFTVRVVLNVTRTLTDTVDKYVKHVRSEILESL